MPFEKKKNPIPESGLILMGIKNQTFDIIVTLECSYLGMRNFTEHFSKTADILGLFFGKQYDLWLIVYVLE